MGYIAQEKDYWIHNGALTITLNALGNPNRTMCSVMTSAVIMCYIEDADEDDSLGYNAAHAYKTWPLAVSPTYFNSNTAKYVYVAIPKATSSDTRAMVVFPSEKLDIDGKNEQGAQIGASDYLYIYLQAKISATNGSTNRTWESELNTGKLDTDEGRQEALNESEWYDYSTVTEIVTLLKKISMAATSWFQNLRLGSSERNLTGVAISSDEWTNSDTLVATPGYVSQNYLSKTHDDSAAGEIGFRKGLWVKARNLFGISEDGNAKVNDLDVAGDAEITGMLTALQKIVSNKIQSDNYNGDGPFDVGFLLEKGSDGITRMIVDNLFVRMKAVFNELEIRKISYSGGNIIFSHAGSHVIAVKGMYNSVTARVEGHTLYISGAANVGAHTLYTEGGSVSGHEWTPTGSEVLYAYRCYLMADDGTTATENWWRVDDQARCQTFNIKEGVYQNVSNQFYWRRVIATGQEVLEDGKTYDYVDLSISDCIAGSTVPQAGDQIVQMGNRTDTDRQGFISIEVSGENAPGFKVYKGVNSYSLDGKRKICLSPNLSEIRAQKFITETEYDIMVQPHQRSEAWYTGMQCYYYDLVQHNGATWLCIYPESGIGGVMYTTEEPTELAQYWRVYARAGKDGSDGKSFNILGSYDTEQELIAAHLTGQVGDAYIVAGFLYVWDEVNNEWHNSGKIQGDPGRGISYATITYGVSSSATTFPSTWVASPSELVIGQGDYLYTRTILTYDDNTTSSPAYSITRFGTDGSYKSIAFCRTNQDISNESLTGGTISNPVPNSISVGGETITFYDGIPDGEATVWAASNLFYGDGRQAGWTTAKKMTDTATFDVEFSPNTTKPANPSDTVSERNAQGWYDPERNPTYDFTTSIWRAERHCKNGVWSAWAIEKIKGEKGDSITKSSETAYYIKNTTGVRPAENDPNWSTTKPTLSQGEWLFTKIVIVWSDNSTTILYTDERNPNDGEDGQDIIVDGSTVMKYYVGASNTTHPADDSSDWKDLSQVTQEQGKWLWSQAKTYYRKSSSASGAHDAGISINYNVSYISKDGKTGRGIQSITEYYQATNSSASRQAPTSENGWSTDPNLSDLTDKWDQNHKYLWNMEKTVYSNVDGTTTTEYSVPKILAIWTKDGAAGKGIDSIQNYYKITDSLTAPAKTDTGWSTTPVAPTAENPYLWNYEVITWINPADTTSTDVQMIGHYGRNGDNALVTDLTNEMDAVAMTSDGKVAAQVTVETYIRQYYGTTLQTLTDISWSTLPTGIMATKNVSTGLLTFAVAKDAQFTNDKAEITLTATSARGSQDVVFTIQGFRAGADGDDAVIYQLVPSDTAIKKSKTGFYTPTMLSCKVTKRVGNNPTTDYTGNEVSIMLKVDDGNEVDYTSPISIAVLQPEKGVTFKLYHGQTLIDVETIAVTEDGTNGIGAANCYFEKGAVSVHTDSTGKVTEAVNVVVPFNMYLGTAQLIPTEVTIQEGGTTHYASLTRSTLFDVTEDSVEGHTWNVADGKVEGHTLILEGDGYNTCHAAVRIQIPVGVTLDEHNVAIAVVARDDEGNEYLGYDTLIIQGTRAGASGEDAFTIDLSNEVDAFGTDSGNIVVNDQVRDTNVRMFLGSQAQTLTGLSAMLYYDDGDEVDDDEVAEIDCQYSGTTGTVTVSVYEGGDFSGINGLYAEITAQCAKGSKTAKFTLQKVKSGAPGVSPTIYQLAPSKDQIPVGRTAAGGYTPSTVSLQCGYKKIIGSQVTIVDDPTSSFDGYNLVCRRHLRGGDWEKYNDEYIYIIYSRDNGSARTLLNSLNVATYDDVEFYIVPLGATVSYQGQFYYIDTVDGYIDKENVPIVSDGVKGDTGEDSVNVIVSPASLIVNQDLNDPTNLSSLTEEFIVSVNKGGVAKTVNNIVFTAEMTSDQQYYKAKFLRDGGSPNGTGTVSGNKLTLKSIETYQETVGTETKTYYYDTVFVDCVVTYDTNKTISTRIRIYANLLGTWKETVENDTKTEVASMKYYTYDKDGHVVSQQTIGEYVRSSSMQTSSLQSTVMGQGTSITNLNSRMSTAEQNISTVSKEVISSNLLPGTADGEGWFSGNDSLSFDIETKGFGLDDQDIAYSPTIIIKKGSPYTVSFEDVEGFGYLPVLKIALTNIRGDQMTKVFDIDDRDWDSEDYRRFASFFIDSSDLADIFEISAADAAAITDIYLSFTFFNDDGERQDDLFAKPQIELGSTMNDWQPNPLMVSRSEVKQTAEEIDLSIRSGLNSTGINIQNQEIKLKANKTQFLTSAGVPMIAVQMCDSNGNVGTGAGYTIPSIVFYNGQIGASGVTAQWVLNYLGLIQTVNSSMAAKFTNETGKLLISYEYSHTNGYDGKGMTTSTTINATYMAYSEAYGGNTNYGLYYPTMYLYHCAYYFENGVKKYIPANGVALYEDRYWMTDSMDSNNFPNGANQSRYFLIQESYEINRMGIIDPVTHQQTGWVNEVRIVYALAAVASDGTWVIYHSALTHEYTKNVMNNQTESVTSALFYLYDDTIGAGYVTIQEILDALNV